MHKLLPKNDSLLRILIYLITRFLYPIFSCLSKWLSIPCPYFQITYFSWVQNKNANGIIEKGNNIRFKSKIASITKYLCTNIKLVLFFMPQAHVVKVLPGLQIIFLCQTKYYHRHADDIAVFRGFLGKRKRKFIWS